MHNAVLQFPSYRASCLPGNPNTFHHPKLSFKITFQHYYFEDNAISHPPEPVPLPRVYPVVSDDHDGAPVPHLEVAALSDLAAVEHIHVAFVEVVPVAV